MIEFNLQHDHVSQKIENNLRDPTWEEDITHILMLQWSLHHVDNETEYREQEANSDPNGFATRERM